MTDNDENKKQEKFDFATKNVCSETFFFVLVIAHSRVNESKRTNLSVLYVGFESEGRKWKYCRAQMKSKVENVFRLGTISRRCMGNATMCIFSMLTFLLSNATQFLIAKSMLGVEGQAFHAPETWNALNIAKLKMFRAQKFQNAQTNHSNCIQSFKL